MFSIGKMHIFVTRLHPSQQNEVSGDVVQEADPFPELLHHSIHQIQSSESKSVFKIYPEATYLDMDCVPGSFAGESRVSKAKYLRNSSIFVPIITWGRDHSVLNELARINEESDVESDFVVYALVAIYLLHNSVGRLKTVFSILQDESGGQCSMMDACRQLSKKPSLLSCERACSLLQQGGVRKERERILEFLLKISVQDAVLLLLPAGWCEEAPMVGGNKGTCAMYVMPDGEVEKGAVEAAELITDCLVSIVNKHIERKLWEFSNHNPRGIEVLQVLRELGVHEQFNEYFALRGIESFERLSSLGHNVSLKKECNVVFRSCDEVVTVMSRHDEDSIKTLQMLASEHKRDKRFRPLNERLRQYRDTDVNGVLALRTSNSLETALVKLPARVCITFLSTVYLVFGIKQLMSVWTESIWLPEANSTTPVEPRTVKISVIADPIISFYWSFLFLSGIVIGIVNTPLRAKWLLLFTGHLVIVGNLFCALSDFVQCSTQGTGIGSYCSGTSHIVTVIFVAFAMYLAHFVQHYFWIAAFFLQGAFCLFSFVDIEGWFRMLFLALGLGCFVVAFIIVLQFRKQYRKTFMELTAAMKSFDESWETVREQNTQAIEEINQRVRSISQELNEVIKGGTKTWTLYLSVMLGMRRSRYSSRNDKIRQESSDFERLFLQAQEISAQFQLWVSSWNQVGRVEHGNVKSCSRAMQKTVRSYQRDPSCLTDLVRCTVVVQSIDEVLAWVTFLREQSVVGFEVNGRDKPGSSRVTSEDIEAGRDAMRGDIFMSITSIKNRYDPSYKASISGGYRDLCVCVEVGWTRDEMNQTCSLVPVREWGQTAGLRKHICEIQVGEELGTVLLEEMHAIKKLLHKEYVNFRNTLCQ
ncbi:hypothetical protein GUITHDRAFT_111645 [Guillardia theta CCMP2712]|uniref:Uncharacterized protein n=1 Tax=Guillardia theta (strain CCMP2712) TaxID=905079 RepID=L1J1G8_GUITC|nr:hypothetical protein GUITHDRAFT_111645 [Guillardia theta CCMP2712]EKX42368.1 hypothetical protein GUITHDRAFT_111645 [Guillardia theta CCMP2712]|eukprot:XP_005829348.1 hypothetical protein GUITHDRAFT_111645 [Guillardia theta CCMP2712]